MITILLGPPGSGKGTSAEYLCKEYNLFAVSTGDLLRSRAKGTDELAKQIAEIMASGKLISNEIINEMVKEVVASLSTSTEHKGLLFDGYPRTVQQASSLDDILSSNGMKVDAVLLFNISDNAIIERLCSRRIDRNTGIIYNLISNPPPADQNLDLYQREDDKEETILKRLEVYKEQTAPLIDYYKAKGQLIDIAADKPVDEMINQIKEHFKK